MGGSIYRGLEEKEREGGMIEGVKRTRRRRRTVRPLRKSNFFANSGRQFKRTRFDSGKLEVGTGSFFLPPKVYMYICIYTMVRF